MNSSSLTSEEYLKKVQEDIEYLDRSYDSVYPLLKDAMTGAMSWAPNVVMNKATPNSKDLYALAVRLLTVCYCTERNMRKSGEAAH